MPSLALSETPPVNVVKYPSSFITTLLLEARLNDIESEVVEIESGDSVKVLFLSQSGSARAAELPVAVKSRGKKPSIDSVWLAGFKELEKIVSVVVLSLAAFRPVSQIRYSLSLSRAFVVNSLICTQVLWL